MRLYLNTETGGLSLQVSGPPLQRLDVKQRDVMRLEVFPSTALPQGTSGIFAVKETFDGEVMAFAAAWSAPEQSGAGYVFVVNLHTAVLEEKFTGDVAQVKLRAELRWERSPGDVRRSMTFDLVVARAVYLGEEGAPISLPEGTLVSPDGKLWRLRVSNDGVLGVVEL